MVPILDVEAAKNCLRADFFPRSRWLEQALSRESLQASVLAYERNRVSGT